jgi:hypothetical protein
LVEGIGPNQWFEPAFADFAGRHACCILIYNRQWLESLVILYIVAFMRILAEMKSFYLLIFLTSEIAYYKPLTDLVRKIVSILQKNMLSNRVEFPILRLNAPFLVCWGELVLLLDLNKTH